MAAPDAADVGPADPVAQGQVALKSSGQHAAGTTGGAPEAVDVVLADPVAQAVQQEAAHEGVVAVDRVPAPAVVVELTAWCLQVAGAGLLTAPRLALVRAYNSLCCL